MDNLVRPSSYPRKKMDHLVMVMCPVNNTHCILTANSNNYILSHELSWIAERKENILAAEENIYLGKLCFQVNAECKSYSWRTTLKRVESWEFVLKANHGGVKIEIQGKEIMRPRWENSNKDDITLKKDFVRCGISCLKSSRGNFCASVRKKLWASNNSLVSTISLSFHFQCVWAPLFH